MTMAMRWALLYALALIALAGCAQLETRPTEKVEFDLAGRIAARFGDESFTGNIAWRHAGDLDEMLLTSPLGAGVARIVREGDKVILTTAEPREYRAEDAESLTEQVLGFRLPLGGLADWVRGRPSPESAARAEHSPDGRLLSLEQRGWKIVYQDYAGALPSRLRLVYPGIELRLAITQWK
ncbi:MAG TPA: lipoprotein insertase outer membrane protein LolB [Burkholderiales bacterium]|nr:lipoprotein insertase outer membrane protein LolB [Burkholderiales bacterium]